MVPKQGESENTGGKTINQSLLVERRKERGQKRGRKKIQLLFAVVAFQFV